MIEEELKDYLNYLLIKGYNKDTCLTRYQNVKEFLEFTKLEIEKISSLEIIKYHHYLKQRPNKITQKDTIKSNTILHHIRAIELFFLMLFELGKRKELVEVNIKYPKNYDNDFVREIVSQEEIKKLYKTANKQEEIILHLAYGCGLRVAELVAVNKQDIYLKEQILIVPKGKNNKRRMIPLTEKICTDLENYLEEIEKQNTFMLNSKGGKMQEWTYNKRLKKMLKQIAISQERIAKICIHSLRHSIATHLLQNGMQLEKVRDFLGHSQLETTETYTHITASQLRIMNYEL